MSCYLNSILALLILMNQNRLICKEMKRLPLYKCVAPSRRKTFVHAITIISAARNALMIPACGLIAYFWNTAADNTGRISMTG